MVAGLVVAELCILFFYHRVDEHTSRHFELVKRNNPSAVVVPITDEVTEHLPGGVDLATTPSRWPTANKWAAIDTALYRWFEHHRVPARRYVVFEYDVFCNQSVTDAYRSVWDADVACANIKLPWRQPHWPFFQPKHLLALPREQRRFAAGIAPFVGALYSHDALEAIVRHVTTNDVFCELRLGTAARCAGLEIVRLPAALQRSLVWHPVDVDTRSPGIYHSIKPDPTAARREHLQVRSRRILGLPGHLVRTAQAFAIWARAELEARRRS